VVMGLLSSTTRVVGPPRGTARFGAVVERHEATCVELEDDVDYERPSAPLPTTIERGLFWEWDPQTIRCGCAVPVHYTVAHARRFWRRRPSTAPLVFLHGFGVGEFHFEHNLEAMASLTGRDCYAFDLVGQGKSWPRCGEGKGLQVGAETWIDQTEAFVREVVKAKPILVGNSLGGFLAAVKAGRDPSFVEGLALVNPTPFWGFWPSETGAPIWDATLPAPRVPLAIGATWFNKLREPSTVCNLVQTVYATKDRCDPTLVTRICEAAEAEYGANVFASILFASRPKESFDESLVAIRDAGVPVGLFYGKEDPWVSPMWGQRAHRRLDGAPYYEISPSGHCPMHETPTAVNLALCDWLENLEHDSTLFDGEFSLEEADGRRVTVAKVDGQPRTPVEHSASYIWG